MKCLLREIDGNGGVLIGPMMLSTFGTCLTSDGSGRVSGELRSTRDVTKLSPSVATSTNAPVFGMRDYLQTYSGYES